MLRSIQNFSASLVRSVSVSKHQQHLLRTNRQFVPSSYSNRSMTYFATPEYDNSFYKLPQPNTDALRNNTILYLEKMFQPKVWYDQPIVSLLKGKELKSNTTTVDTINGLGYINGKQIYSTQGELDEIIQHIQSLQKLQASPNKYNDLRTIIRVVEQQLLNEYSADLIGNQAIDFYKQDGITELEECIMISRIEQRLNDILYSKELIDNSITINRQPIFISTVSNFSNFLDLFRKIIRSLEFGIPIIVLSGRTNTIQHSYRYIQLLQQLINEKDTSIIDNGMITYISAPIQDIHTILQKCQSSNTNSGTNSGAIYATCSRQYAKELKSIYNNTISSTGGPNTMIVIEDKTKTTSPNKNDVNSNTKNNQEIVDTLLTENLINAIRTSATIESSGQCTALRHVIVPSLISNDQISKLFNTNIQQITPTTVSTSTSNSNSLTTVEEYQPLIDSIKNKTFTSIFPNNNNNSTNTNKNSMPTDDYSKSPSFDTYYRINDTTIPSQTKMEEYWRKVVIDFTKLNIRTNPNDFHQLVVWLRTNQPISVSVNCQQRTASLLYGIKLWEQTNVIVFTIGCTADIAVQEQQENNDDYYYPTKHVTMPPALSCQARPQDGEIFGEIPSINTIDQYTKFPVLIPSSNPSYDSYYKTEYLTSRRTVVDVDTLYIKDTKRLLDVITDPVVQGYCIEIIEYLRSVCRLNPKTGVREEDSNRAPTRTVLYGIQRPPLGTNTVIRCSATTTYNDIAPIHLLFWSTTAREQIIVSIHPDNIILQSLFDTCTIPYIIETDTDAATNKDNTKVFQYIDITANTELVNKIQQYPLADKLTSLFFPMGHIKSTGTDTYDEEFELRARTSSKWLNTVF